MFRLLNIRDKKSLIIKIKGKLITHNLVRTKIQFLKEVINILLKHFFDYFRKCFVLLKPAK